jgi:hypothetical protein
MAAKQYWYLLYTSFLHGSFFNPEKDGDIYLRSFCCTMSHGIISQKIELFMQGVGKDLSGPCPA